MSSSPTFSLILLVLIVLPLLPLLSASATYQQQLKEKEAPPLLLPPYPVSARWTYYLEAVRAKEWPACQVRFLSYPNPSCNEINMWESAGGNQEFTAVEISGKRSSTQNKTNSSLFFALGASNCARSTHNNNKKKPPVVGYSVKNCADTQFTLSADENSTSSSVFEFRPAQGKFGQYVIVAADREPHCPSSSILSFDHNSCAPNPGPENVFLAGGSSSSSSSTWRAVPSAPPVAKNVTPAVGFGRSCADPFWWKEGPSDYFLTCTGGDISLYSAPAAYGLNYTIQFDYRGQALGGHPSSWCKDNARWAPETHYHHHHHLHQFNNNNNVSAVATTSTMVLCDMVEPNGGGPHRIGYVVAPKRGTGVGHFDQYSKTFLKLSPGDAGDIDPHIFVDTSSSSSKKTYLVWKQDQNRIGSMTTRIWAQEILISSVDGKITQIGNPRVIMGSCCLWWIEGFAGPDSSLVEGPEVIFRKGWYYLFFAAGRYNDYSYTEGVARSKSIWGPYEKYGVPVINTGQIGYLKGKKLLGPGHAGFIFQEDDDVLYAIYHAHVDGSPRTVFVTKLTFVDDDVNGDGAWPVATLEGNW